MAQLCLSYGTRRARQSKTGAAGEEGLWSCQEVSGAHDCAALGAGDGRLGMPAYWMLVES